MSWERVAYKISDRVVAQEESRNHDGKHLFSSDVVEQFGGNEELLSCLESLSEKLRELQHRYVD